MREPLINSESFRYEVKIRQIKAAIAGKTQNNRFAHGASFSQSIDKIAKLPLLLTPLTYMTAMDGGNAKGLQGATLAPVGDDELVRSGVPYFND
jgi:hypothetical protein